MNRPRGVRFKRVFSYAGVFLTLRLIELNNFSLKSIFGAKGVFILGPRDKLWPGLGEKKRSTHCDLNLCWVIFHRSKFREEVQEDAASSITASLFV